MDITCIGLGEFSLTDHILVTSTLIIVHTQGDPNQHSAHPLSQHTYTHTHTHTQAHTDRCIWCFMDTHRPAHAQQLPTLHQPRVGAVLQPIWSPDPAGLSLSLGVGWGWGISPWRELISVVLTQQG